MSLDGFWRTWPKTRIWRSWEGVSWSAVRGEGLPNNSSGASAALHPVIDTAPDTSNPATKAWPPGGRKRRKAVDIIDRAVHTTVSACVHPIGYTMPGIQTKRTAIDERLV